MRRINHKYKDSVYNDLVKTEKVNEEWIQNTALPSPSVLQTPDKERAEEIQDMLKKFKPYFFSIS